MIKEGEKKWNLNLNHDAVGIAFPLSVFNAEAAWFSLSGFYLFVTENLLKQLMFLLLHRNSVR